jgi:hypothetical protein
MWSNTASDLLHRKKQLRRRITRWEEEHDIIAYKETANQLRKEIKRTSRACWRKHIAESTANPLVPHNKGLWKLASWARKKAGKPPTTPHIPALRRRDGEATTDNNDEKAQILAERFFPKETQAYTDDIPPNQSNPITLDIPPEIDPEELQRVIRDLPKGKAPGPDGIPNEALQMILPDRINLLAEAIGTVLASGRMPLCLKESTTIVLRKEQKKDYTLASSYRPIALENTLAKLIEKVVADKITHTAETNNLLPWNQMGARKNRSTLSGLDLLISTIQTAWKSRKGTIVSMLSLDITAAFDNVSHKRLLWILDRLGLPEWMIQFTASFLSERKTRIAHSGISSNWIPTTNGIPQGSTISPILFLLFISDLLKDIQNPAEGMLAFGFVDDTNLVAWGPSAKANCRTLERAHNICLTWAHRHGAKFAPEKYHLIHFTRQRKDPRGDLQSCVKIDNHEITAETSVKVLGA